MYKIFFKICLIISILTNKHCLANGIDCKIAKTNVEKIICDNKYIIDLDTELNNLYKEAKAHNINSIINSQLDWLKKRNLCSYYACIKEQYLTRNQQIRAVLSKPTKIDKKFFGRFEKIEDVYMFNSDSYKPAFKSAQYIDISPGNNEFEAIINIKLFGANAHMCSFRNAIAVLEYGVLKITQKVQEEIYGKKECHTYIKYSNNYNQVTLEENEEDGCRKYNCGARNGFNGWSLPRKTKD